MKKPLSLLLIAMLLALTVPADCHSQEKASDQDTPQPVDLSDIPEEPGVAGEDVEVIDRADRDAFGDPFDTVEDPNPVKDYVEDDGTGEYD